MAYNVAEAFLICRRIRDRNRNSIVEASKTFNPEQLERNWKLLKWEGSSTPLIIELRTYTRCFRECTFYLYLKNQRKQSTDCNFWWQEAMRQLQKD